MMNLEKPISRSNNSTYRNLCGDSIENQFILESLLKLEHDESNTYCNNDKIFTTKSCNINLFGDIINSNNIKDLISEVLIRFDTDPNYYTKDDYKVLLKIVLAAYELNLNANPNIIYINDIKQPSDNGETFITINGNEYVNVNTDEIKTDIFLQMGDLSTNKNGIATVENISNYLTFENIN